MHADGERGEHQEEDDEELDDVDQHAAQWDLQRAQVGVRLEEVDDASKAEDVGDGEQALGHQHGLRVRPVAPAADGWMEIVRQSQVDGATWNIVNSMTNLRWAIILDLNLV